MIILYNMNYSEYPYKLNNLRNSYMISKYVNDYEEEGTFNSNFFFHKIIFTELL